MQSHFTLREMRVDTGAAISNRRGDLDNFPGPMKGSGRGLSLEIEWAGPAGDGGGSGLGSGREAKASGLRYAGVCETQVMQRDRVRRGRATRRDRRGRCGRCSTGSRRGTTC